MIKYNSHLTAHAYLCDEDSFYIVITNDDLNLNSSEDLSKNISISETDKYICEQATTRAIRMYGDTLPDIVSKRLNTELSYISQNGFSPVLLLSQFVIKYAHDNGQLTSSRGLIGSSFVAFLLGITNVNPLLPHYCCSDCKHTEFISDNSVYSGYDLPSKECPVCGNKMISDGHNIPFETFMRFEGDKLPNIKISVPICFKDNILKYIGALLGQDCVLMKNANLYISKPKINDKCNAEFLGFIPLEVLTRLETYTGITTSMIDINDPKIFELFANSRSIGIDSDELATLGLPEYNTEFIRDIIKMTKPTNFGDIVRISNLSHGTDVWIENAELLLKDNICDFRDLPTAREDVYNYLISRGMESTMALKITDAVRKGDFERKGFNKEPKIVEYLVTHNIPSWYVDSLYKVRYMFPKAHSVENVKIALTLAWYKIYHPVEFYVANFNTYYSDIRFEFSAIETNSLQIIPKPHEWGDDVALFMECIDRGIFFERNNDGSECPAPYSVGDGKILVNY